MKKIFMFLFVSVCACMFSCSAFAGDITLRLDGRDIECDRPPFITQDRTLVPLRAVSEGMGYNVLWNENDQSILISGGSADIRLFIGDTKYVTGGKEMYISVAPVIVDDRTMVPVRVVAETLGCSVYWDELSSTVCITSVGTPYTYVEDGPGIVTVSGDYISAVNCNECISLRERPDADSALITEIPLFDGMKFVSDMGNGFYYVCHYGTYGYVNADYISAFEPQVYDGRALVVNCMESITMRTSASTAAAEIMQVPLGAEVVKLFASHNGFRLISYNGRIGWVLDGYLEDIGD